MKIEPALPPPPGPQAATPTDGAPEMPFEAFLGGEVSSGRTFGFAELGMFGRERHAPSTDEALPAPAPPVDQAGVNVPIASLDGSSQAQSTPPTASDQIAVEPGQRPTRAVAEPERGKNVARDTAALDDPAPVVGIQELPALEEATTSGPAAFRTPIRAQARRSDVSLIVREKDGAVEVVAAGPALDPETRILLRRLSRSILAEWGLDLAQFHLNGVPLAPDSQIMIGGSHGTRTN